MYRVTYAEGVNIKTTRIIIIIILVRCVQNSNGRPKHCEFFDCLYDQNNYQITDILSLYI